MRRLRWLAAAVAAVAALVLAAVVTLATLDLNAYKGEIQAALQDVVGRPVEIKGPLHLAWSPTPSVTAADVRIANAEWGSEPAMATAESVLAHVELWPLLAGDVKVDRLSLRRARLLLERGPDGQGNWQALGGPGGDGKERGRGEPAIRRIALSDSTVVWKRRPDAEEHVYRIGELLIEGGAPTTPSRITLTGELRGEPLQLTGDVPALAILLETGRSSPLDLQGTLAGAPVALAGDMTVARGPDGGIERVSLAKLSATYGGIDAAGSAALDLAGEGVRLLADLRAGEVDLGRHAGGRDGPGGDPLGRRLPLDLLPGIDGKVELAVTRLIAGRWVLEEVSATATLERGKLTLDPVKGRVAGGAMWAHGTVDTARTPAAFTLVGSGDGLDMAQFYRALTDEGLIEGKGDATIDLEASGDTPRALLTGMDGAARLVIRDGVILNRYWELIAADLAREFVPFAKDSDRSRLNCLVGRFDIKRGTARAVVLMVDTDRVLVGGAGTIRLVDQRLDMRLVPQPKDPSLISLATPILLRGTIQDPKVSPDPVEVAKGLGAIAAGTLIGPLAVLLPFVSGGSVDRPCPAAIAVAEGRKPPAVEREPTRAPPRAEQNKPGGIRGLFDNLRKAIE